MTATTEPGEYGVKSGASAALEGGAWPPLPQQSRGERYLAITFVFAVRSAGPQLPPLQEPHLAGRLAFSVHGSQGLGMPGKVMRL